MNLDNLLGPKKIQVPSSPQQEAIYSTPGPLLIKAGPGCGKTTTLVELSIRRGGEAEFLAFNKPIAQELASRVRGAYVRTLNALGHSILTRHRPKAKLDNWFLSRRISARLKDDENELYGQAIRSSIEMVKANAIFYPQESDFYEFIQGNLDIPAEHQQRFAKIAFLAFEEQRHQESFDFNDQLYIPVREEWSFPKREFVYVDEAQDLSPINRLMLQAMVDKGAILTAVGDKFQAIYAFRGAAHDSMDLLGRQFNLQELPLSVSYRCAKSIVKLCNHIDPTLMARPGAPEGIINYMSHYPKVTEYNSTDIILCRNNAPLADLVLQFLARQIPCRVQSNFLETIDKFLRRWDCSSSKDLMKMLDFWLENELDGPREEAAKDRHQVLSAFAKQYDTVDEIIKACQHATSSMVGTRITTIHRAKGLEAERVFFLRPDLLPSKRAISPEAIQQETNLYFVGISRAKNELNFLPPGED